MEAPSFPCLPTSTLPPAFASFLSPKSSPPINLHVSRLSESSSSHTASSPSSSSTSLSSSPSVSIPYDASPQKTFDEKSKQAAPNSPTTACACTLAPPPPDLTLSQGLNLPFVGPVRWLEPLRWLRAALRNPLNVVTFFMVGCMAVVISLNFSAMAHIALAMGVLKSAQEEKLWIEFCNQILNAVGTLGCLVVHPLRCHYVVQLIRWRAEDVLGLRAALSAGGAHVEKPHERRHLSVVVALLQLNCLGQYGIALFMWFVSEPDRPLVPMGFIVLCALGSLIAAGLYCLYSPLGWRTATNPVKGNTDPGEGGSQGNVVDAELGSEMAACTECGGRKTVATEGEVTQEEDGEDVRQQVAKRFGKRGEIAALPACGKMGEEDRREWRKAVWTPETAAATTAQGGKTLTTPSMAVPEWEGSLFGCWEDGWTVVAATLCCFCVHGWNVERAGFGNKIVHTFMFVFFLFGPITVFSLGARPLRSPAMQGVVFGLGLLVTLMGLTYGGYWRWRQRRSFQLPARKWCCGHRAATDFATWYVAPCCALCQEVRTVKRYGLHMYADVEGEQGRVDQDGGFPGAAGKSTATTAPSKASMETR